MSEVIAKHSRMPRRYSRRTLRKREEQAKAGMGNLDGVDPKAVVARYAAGEKIRDLAQEYAVSRIALYALLLRLVPDEWQAAQKARAVAMKEGGEDGLDEATDPLEVAIAREKLRAGQWDLERVDRKNYGRDEATFNINVFDLGERLRRAKERSTQVIEGEISTARRIDHAGALGADPTFAPALDQAGRELESDVQPQQSTAAMGSKQA